MTLPTIGHHEAKRALNQLLVKLGANYMIAEEVEGVLKVLLTRDEIRLGMASIKVALEAMDVLDP